MATGRSNALIRFQPMPGLVDTPHDVFLARGATHVGDPSSLEERSIVASIPLADVERLVRDGLLLGSGTYVGLLHVLAFRRGSRPRREAPTR